MKKLIRTLTLTIGVCLALLCSAQAIELKTGIGIVETNGLRLRAKPSTEADILDNASYGDNVVIIRESGDFYLVDYNLQIGYMAKGYVTFKERENVAKTERERDNLAVYFMDAYNSLGNYEKAIQYARQGLAGKFRIVGMEGHFYDVIFSAMQQLGKSRQEQLDLLDEAMEHHPEEICFVMEKGYVLWQAKDYLSAKVYLEKGLTMRQDFEAKLAQGQLLTDSSLRLLPYVYHALGDIAYKSGNKAQAAELFLQGIMVYKYAGELLAGLYNCLRDGDTVEIIQLINSLYDSYRLH